ncbi:MAG: hypothetical protein K9I92_06435 [Chitinophagaceae bacterium]|nr:hypothetical protein [Chitinophagaceae bacterium]
MKRLIPQLFNQLLQAGIANSPALLNKNSVLQWSNNGTINQNVVEHLNSYLVNANFHQQNQQGPYEIHPYLAREEEHFDLNKRCLLLGTFPPNSYIRNIPGIVNPILNPNLANLPNVDFFYGNMASLWDCFGIGNNPGLDEILSFLYHNSISVSDVILGAQRKNFGNGADEEYRNIVLNDKLINVFNSNSKIENILFTSGKLSNLQLMLNGNLNAGVSALKGFIQILIDHHINFEISGDITGNGIYYEFNDFGILASIAQQNNHLIWWIKTTKKKVRIINLPAPSGNANQQIPSAPLFFRWVTWVAIQHNIAPPVLGQNLMHDYLPQHNIFIQPYTTQYKRDIYSLALNDLITLQTI